MGSTNTSHYSEDCILTAMNQKSIKQHNYLTCFLVNIRGWRKTQKRLWNHYPQIILGLD